MNLDFYKNFLLVAECGNITQAAERLNLAQPALSGQLKALETHYGTRLIEAGRGRRQIRLTAAGMDFLRHAKEICHAAEALDLELAGYATSRGGSLRLATSPAVMESFMEQFLLPFAQRYPAVTLQLKEEVVAAQLEDMKKGHIDIAYANAPLPDSDSFNCRHLATEHFYAVWRKDSALCADLSTADGAPPALPLEALHGLPLSCNHGSLALLTELCHARGFTPSLRLVTSTGPAVVQFIASGLAVGVLPDSCCRHLPPALARALLDEPKLSYSQTLLWPKDRALCPAARDFLTLVNTAP